MYTKLLRKIVKFRKFVAGHCDGGHCGGKSEFGHCI